MRPETERRTQAILLALSGLSAAEVEAAADAVPSPLREHLLALSQALQSPDPKSALQELIEPLSENSDTIQAQLDAAEQRVRDQLFDLKRALQRIGQPVADLDLDITLPDNPDDPVLSAILAEALQLGDLNDLAALVRETVAEGAALSDEMAEMVAAARRQPEQTARRAEEMKARVGRLQAALEKLQAAQESLPAALGVLARMRRLAEERRHPVAVDIALSEAALWDARGDLPPRLVQQRWRDAMDVALRFQALQAARQAAQQLQLIALSRQDPLPAATAAAEIATLARAKDHHRAEVLALLEESLILATLRERRDHALRRLRDAIARAEGQGAALQARVRLSAGQTLERLGEHAEARRAWRALINTPNAEAETPAEFGRALLYVGRQEVRRGQHDNARKILTHARDIGRRTGNWLLYAPALIALLEDRIRHDDLPGSAALLREARALAQIGGDQAVTAVEGMVGYLKGKWGDAAVEAALA